MGTWGYTKDDAARRRSPLPQRCSTSAQVSTINTQALPEIETKSGVALPGAMPPKSAQVVRSRSKPRECRVLDHRRAMTVLENENADFRRRGDPSPAARDSSPPCQFSVTVAVFAALSALGRNARRQPARLSPGVDRRFSGGKPTLAAVVFVLIIGVILAVVHAPRGIVVGVSTTPPAAASRSRCRDRHRFPFASACDCRACNFGTHAELFLILATVRKSSPVRDPQRRCG